LMQLESKHNSLSTPLEICRQQVSMPQRSIHQARFLLEDACLITGNSGSS
jgi:hypothetical protein